MWRNLNSYKKKIICVFKFLFVDKQYIDSFSYPESLTTEEKLFQVIQAELHTHTPRTSGWIIVLIGSVRKI